MTKPTRRSTLWSREKIAHLIELYKHNDCLWNHYTDDYKNKDLRNKAIMDICAELKIDKFAFGKKIHNLRNQFNTEMKKLERRIDEAGGEVDTSTQRCRWEHFEPLLFLKSVIEPRFAGCYQQQTQPIKASTPKFKYDLITDKEAESEATTSPQTEGVTEFHFEEATSVDAGDFFNEEETPSEFQSYAEVPGGSQKYNATVTTGADGKQQTTITVIPSTQLNSNIGNGFVRMERVQPKPERASTQLHDMETIQVNCSPNLSTGSVIELPSSTPATSSGNASPSGRKKQRYDSRDRDQWDAFGELIAGEFRLLNSDISRKKLKRRIMQALVEVGVEDDGLS